MIIHLLFTPVIGGPSRTEAEHHQPGFGQMETLSM